MHLLDERTQWTLCGKDPAVVIGRCATKSDNKFIDCNYCRDAMGIERVNVAEDEKKSKRSVYHKDVPTKTIDVYRVLRAFGVTDQCIGHAIKKLLLPGQRSGGKSLEQDVKEAIWTLTRWVEMNEEETRK